MKKLYFIILFVFADITLACAQLTETQLLEAVQHQACSAIIDDLRKTTLTTEEMQFNGGVCYFRTGDINAALEIFQDIHHQQGERWKGGAFWEAKCLVALKRDDEAVAILKSLPKGFLNILMLSQNEFKELDLRNDDFSKLKYSLQPRFNIWTILLSIVAFIGLGIGLLLMAGKSKFTTGRKWLILLVITFTLILFAYLTMWTGYVFYFPYLGNTWAFLSLLIGPSLYFYLKEVFQEDFSIRDVYVHYLVPFLSFALTVPAILGDFGINSGLPADLSILASSSTLLTGQVIYYAVRIYDMRKNDWQVDTNIRMWTRILIWGMMIYTIAFISYFILAKVSFFNPQWDYAISAVMALGILVIAYMGIVQKRVFKSEPIETFLPVQKYKTSSLTNDASESIKRKLERLLQDQQVFKENELRLDDLASYLDINRHQLSQVINEHYGINFFELINRSRVEYVKKVLADPGYEQYTIIQIAYEAGFNNKASFNRYFKKEIGITPSAYRIKEAADYKGL